MKKKIDVLGIPLDDCTAKEVIKKLNGWMKEEPLHLIRVLTAPSLVRFAQGVEQKERLESMDLVVAGDRTILDAAGIGWKSWMQGRDDCGMIQVMFHYFHKNNTRVFLLADTQEQTIHMENFFKEQYKNIQIVGKASVPGDDNSDDKIINQINGAEAECIIANIISDHQDAFVCRCRDILSASVWLGVSGTQEMFLGAGSWWHQMFRAIGKRILKKRVEIEKKKRNA